MLPFTVIVLVNLYFDTLLVSIFFFKAVSLAVLQVPWCVPCRLAKDGES